MRVAIVGAGAAGLRTAMLLEEAGAEVQVFEARGRVGGRLQTVRLETGWYEAGGEWIDAEHSRVLGLLDELGQAAEPSDERPALWHFGGRAAPEDDWPVVAAEMARLEARVQANAATATASDDDSKSLGAFLDAFGLEPDARLVAEAIHRSDEGNDTDRVGLLGWLIGQKQYAGRGSILEGMSSARFAAGAQAMCEAMAGRLARPPALEKTLRGVQQSDDHVELWFEDEVAFADRAVLTLPPWLLLGLDMEPEWPEAHRAAFGAMGRSPALKVALRFRSEWWEGHGWNGRMLTELGVQQFWPGGRDGAAILLAYVCGRGAERLSALGDRAVGAVLEDLCEVFPTARDEFLVGEAHDWVADLWSAGGFSGAAPGSVALAYPVRRRPHSRVHLAGEWTADWIGFIEGALESAERVAKEVIDAESVSERARA
jgi:monoamine oxidase